MRYFHLCLLSICLLGLSAQSHAQESEYRPYQPDKKPTANTPLPLQDSSRIKYEHLADTLLDYDPVNYDYTRLRRFYAQTPYYDPLAEEAVKKLQNLAYYANNNRPIGEATSTPELDAYKDHLRLHIASLAVVAQALALAQDDPYFGDPKKLESIKEGLFESLLKTGNGRTLDLSYTVYTMPEETALLRYFHYKILQTKTYKEGLVDYDLHYVIDPTTNKNLAIFVNITAPMTALRRESLKIQ